MKKIFILLSFCILNLSCFADEVSEYKQILYGRKDLIRNDLVKSNNQMCLTALQNQNSQFNALNKYLIILTDRNKDLERELTDCKAKKK